jgi:hypothetical protein
MDPLEIAYGPTVGTHTEITTDDFKVDTDSGQHKPHQENTRPARQNHVPREDNEPTGEVSGDTEEEERGSGTDPNPSPKYGVDGEDEFRNVWGR